MRVLRKKHLEQFPWLAVSQLSKGAFCLPCVLFGAGGVGGRSDGHGQPLGALVTCPLQQFKKLTGKDGALSKHEKLNYHKEAVVMKDNFDKTVIEARHDDILSQLDNAHQEKILRNRSYLLSIADTVLKWARHNIALRGHRNEVGCVSVNGVEPEENDGNFRALLRYRIRGGDNQLASSVKKAKQNATYHSAEIQNDLISTAASLIKDEVISRATAASFWSIIADETADRQKRELSAIVIRYAYVKEGKWVCVEDPVAVMDIIQRATAQDVQGELRLTGSVIGSIFLSIDKELRLNLSRCVGQGYDGASVLASNGVGASSKFRSESNHAYYFHCVMHCLNLSATKAVSVPAIRNAHDTINQVVTCFKSSSKRTLLLKSIICNEHDTRISKKHLISLSTTRFVERHTAVQAFRRLLLYIVHALQQMTQWHLYESRNTAQGLLNAISQPSFIISMVILEELSSIMLPPTRNLQTVEIDVRTAMQSIDDLVIALEAMRCEEVFFKLFTCAQTIAH